MILDYKIGDIMTFCHTPGAEWILAEIKEKSYLFVNLWGGEKWVSHKVAPAHRTGPDKLYRDGKLIWKS
jgi:hypothetical protein